MGTARLNSENQSQDNIGRAQSAVNHLLTILCLHTRFPLQIKRSSFRPLPFQKSADYLLAVSYIVTMQNRWPRMHVVTQRSPTNSLKSCLGLDAFYAVPRLLKYLNLHQDFHQCIYKSHY